MLNQGRLCEVGTVEEMFSPPYHPYTETLPGAILEPDPDTEPKSLASDTPELAPPVQGCAFHRRCPHCMPEVCTQEAPTWQYSKGGDSHKIRCHISLMDLISDQAAIISSR